MVVDGGRVESGEATYQVIFLETIFRRSANGFPLRTPALSRTPRKNRNRFFCVRKINNAVMFHKKLN